MSSSIVIRKKNPLRKAEMPITGVIFFYLFIFYAMAAGDPGLMFSKLFAFENGVIGLTFAAFGFGSSVLLNLLQVSRITMTGTYIIASPRLGFRKKYLLADLDKCHIRWYENKAGRFPFIQFNFVDGRKVQIDGYQYTGLKPLILYLRSDFERILREIK